ncbi:unnamed protein product [Camellia sinensis]
MCKKNDLNSSQILSALQGIQSVSSRITQKHVIIMAVVLLTISSYFFSRNGVTGWTHLGAIFLCMTGAEAMFADLGHFNKNSIQLLAAANAANNAQAIITTLLEEYENIFYCFWR